MSKRTGVIRYNLNDNGRTFTGQTRKIDIDAAMRLFNGAALQEAIQKGDIVGYVGHQYREKYKLDVPETVIEGGVPVVLEPALRTIYIKCLPTGDIEHEQEFLDTAPGRVAQRLWESRAYGFSSAIFAPEEGGLRVPKGYFGMDLVRAPNYDSNRGYAVMLDSADAGAFAGVDTFASDNAALLDSVDSMIKESDAFAASVSTDLLKQYQLNDDLIEQNARLLEKLRQANIEAPMLDSAPAVMERGIPMDPGGAMLDSAKRFMGRTDLPGYEAPPVNDDEEKGAIAAVASGMKKTLSVVNSVLRGH
ncbi:hypothetical protein KVG88_30350 [Pseudomonas sp. SWRI74]|uniref:DUF2213 domain-containing protein n=1 Tax=Pseudomonas azerbaijanoccidentalis TaxID=2842347 RepID=A0ABS6QZL0_9PSED|nr:hypothetical protein [Pseudomonas azerbaijanoccidentalis]MBV4524378.1 hypothetical protein [Pseudomonas azerbaijanoccidentalis]